LLMGKLCFHLTASLYFLPAFLGLAPTAVRVKCGWRASRRMKRWPTLPVAPRTPVGQNGQPLALLFEHWPGIACGIAVLFYTTRCPAFAGSGLTNRTASWESSGPGRRSVRLPS
jgi:hypothetical protein